jgi:hypothetical protein
MPRRQPRTPRHVRRHAARPLPGPRPYPIPAGPGHPDAALLALGAEMEALGELLRAWPDDEAAERADARLAAVELEVAALAPRTGAGLAVKLRLARELWAGGDPIRLRAGFQNADRAVGR